MARMSGDAAHHVLPGASHATIWKLLKRSTTGVVICLPPEAHNFTDSAPHLPSCGKPLSKAEIKVVGTDAVEMHLGQLGEIIARSPQNMLGNWNLPEATAMTIRDGWLHTGDAGYVDADGYVYIHDRINDMIISGGENVHSAGVENVLFSHPGDCGGLLGRHAGCPLGRGRQSCGCTADREYVNRNGVDRILPRADRPLQGAEVGRLRGVVASQPLGDSLEAPAARAVLDAS
jgi:acyl-CoA synthetase (AMP-forming)/AMP-acid ligase II